jgi:hypothetical protein
VADNSTLDPGTGGDTIRDKDRAGIKTQIVGLDLGIGTGTESLMSGVMPVSDNSGSLTVDNGGTFAVQIAANSSVNVAQMAGTTTDTNSGVKSAGTQRVVLATDQPQLTNALKVDGSAVTQPVSGTVTANAGTGPFPVSDNAGSLTVDASAATFGVNAAQVSGTAISVNTGTRDAGTQRVILASDQTVVPVSDNSGSLTVDAPAGTPVFVRLSDGAAAITALPVTDNAGSLTVDAPVGTPVFSTPTPSATGGWSKIKYAAQTVTVQTPKGTAATFGGYYIYNPNASVAYLQVFDAATATTITLGTTVPDMIFAIPAASAANIEITCGVNMTNGVKLACTTTATGSTAPGTGLDMTIFFK